MDAKLKSRIDDMVNSAPVFLFMKGNKIQPACGFSNQVNQILQAYKVPYETANVLEDPDLRQGIKEYSDWPTIPQLYVKGEFIGGCDIVTESWQSGELTEALQEAFPDQKIEAPKPPSKPVDIDPAKAAEMLKNKDSALFLDVRQNAEIATAAVEGFQQLDQVLAQELVNNGDRSKPLVFMCHHGGRSAQAAAWFADQGFETVYNVAGGIHQWSTTVDSSIPQY